MTELPMIAEPERCDTCRFWSCFWDLAHEFGREKFETVRDADVTSGFCRRFPPVGGKMEDNVGDQPCTAADEWCGEYQPKKGK